MKSPRNHLYEFEYFGEESKWIFVPPSDYAKSLGLYVLEIGHFYQDGYCYSIRVPENSFCLTISSPVSERFDPDASTTIKYDDGNIQTFEYTEETSRKRIQIYDNRPGYMIEQRGYCDALFIIIAGHLANELFDRFFSRNKHGNCLDIEWKNTIVKNWDTLYSYYRYPAGNVQDLSACILLMQMITRILYEVDSQQERLTDNPYVLKALKLIEKRHTEKIKLQDVAEELHLNPSYLSRLIHSETGATFSNCVRHARINHAKRLLVSTNMTIEEIGNCCGFCDSSHFIKQFLQIEQITPFQYRNSKISREFP